MVTRTRLQTPIFLIGFMASGKSTVGKLLAWQQYLSYVDLDDYIEKKAMQSIPTIFKSSGEAIFRTLEKEALYEVGKQKIQLISTGGGTPCFFDNMAWMCANGTTIFLQNQPKTIVQRLYASNGTHQRPLLKTYKTKASLLTYISNKLHQRNSFYHQAHHTIDCDNKSIDDIIQTIIQLGDVW
ncbi:MAG: shikimate kinase [Chitinophagales bacterium]